MTGVISPISPGARHLRHCGQGRKEVHSTLGTHRWTALWLPKDRCHSWPEMSQVDWSLGHSEPQGALRRLCTCTAHGGDQPDQGTPSLPGGSGGWLWGPLGYLLGGRVTEKRGEQRGRPGPLKHSVSADHCTSSERRCERQKSTNSKM